MLKRVVGLTIATVLGCALFASQASAAPVECGDVITEDLKLEADLTDCPDDGLVVGADRITIDLNGHEVSAQCEPPDCPGRVGIDNSGGYDRVRIRNGMVRGFRQNIVLKRADRNTLAKLEVRGGRPFGDTGSNSLALDHSHRNVIKDSSIAGGDPGILLTASDRNKFARNSLGGGVAIRVGDAVHILDGSDANTLTHNDVGGEGGIVIEDSARNSVKHSSVGSYAGAIYLADAERTLIVGNELYGGFGWDTTIRGHGDRNTIRSNDADGRMQLEGDRNLIASNRIKALDLFDGRAILISAGDRNLIRANETSGAGLNDGPVISIEEAVTRTSLIGNSASDGGFSVPADGIGVDAPGTLIRGNTATDNSGLGINAVEGVIDGGDNHASGNGDPRQCVGVVCTP